MAQVELIMPKMGESIMEATILKWLKQPGDTVEQDEPILEIATDKVDSEVPAPTAGVLGAHLFNEGDTVGVGIAISSISTDGESAAPAAPAAVEVAAEPDPVAAAAPEPQAEVIPAPTAVPEATPAAAPQPVSAPAVTASIPETSRNGGKFYSPLVMNIARQENVSMQELDAIPGTGKNARVTKKDILAYLNNGRNGGSTVAAASVSPAAASVSPAAAPQAAPIQSPTITTDGNVEIIEMDRMRKLIAEHMVRSKHTSAHVTSFVEADVTKMVNWRNKVKKEFEQREGTKLTFTPLFVEAVVKAIKDFPMINSSLDEDNIIIKKDINIGMAAALPSGNLIVPVIRNADQKNLLGLASEVNDLAGRARNNQLKPNEIEGGTFTLTNVGTFGNLLGTPIIFQPQVAILATGAIKKKPVVLETEEGDMIAIRHMMFLSHSYDHRIIDGALGGAFVRRVADYLEQFDQNREV